MKDFKKNKTVPKMESIDPSLEQEILESFEKHIAPRIGCGEYGICGGEKEMEVIKTFLKESLKRVREDTLCKHNGVSGWEAEGRAKGYWGYFEKRVREDEKKRIQGFLLENGHGGGSWRRLIEQL